MLLMDGIWLVSLGYYKYLYKDPKHEMTKIFNKILSDM